MNSKTLQDAICYLIGEWYVEWKSRISVNGGQHRLGVAKEQLKDIICTLSSDKEKCRWDKSFGMEVSRAGNINTEINNVVIYDTDCGYKHTQYEILNRNFKFCPYCSKEIEEIKDESIS